MLFLSSSFLALHPVDIGIPDIPLGDFASDVLVDRRTGGCTSLPGFGVNGLDLSTVVVEFVPHGLLDHLDVLAGSGLFLLGLGLVLVKENSSGFLNFFLDFVVV